MNLFKTNKVAKNTLTNTIEYHRHRQQKKSIYPITSLLPKHVVKMLFFFKFVGTRYAPRLTINVKTGVLSCSVTSQMPDKTWRRVFKSCPVNGRRDFPFPPP